INLRHKQMELLKEIVPNLRRVAFITDVMGAAYRPPEASKITEENRQIAASALGFTWQNFTAAAASDYDEIFARLAAEHFDAAYILADPFNANNLTRISQLALRYRIPTVGNAAWWAKGGLLLAYSQDNLWGARYGVRREDTAWRQAKRPSRRAGDQTFADNQPQNCEGAWPHRAALADRPRRRGDRISPASVHAACCISARQQMARGGHAGF